MPIATKPPAKKRGRKPKSLKVRKIQEPITGVELGIANLRQTISEFAEGLRKQDKRQASVRQGWELVAVLETGVKKVENAYKREQKAQVKIALFPQEVDFEN